MPSHGGDCGDCTRSEVVYVYETESERATRLQKESDAKRREDDHRKNYKIAHLKHELERIQKELNDLSLQ